MSRPCSRFSASTRAIMEKEDIRWPGWRTINENYRRKDRDLPQHLLVRFLQTTVRVRGKRPGIWLATSLLEDKKYPAAEIVPLYGRRWRIETAFAQRKIRPSADVLRSRSPEGMRAASGPARTQTLPRSQGDPCGMEKAICRLGTAIRRRRELFGSHHNGKQDD